MLMTRLKIIKYDGAATASSNSFTNRTTLKLAIRKKKSLYAFFELCVIYALLVFGKQVDKSRRNLPKQSIRNPENVRLNDCDSAYHYDQNIFAAPFCRAHH